MAQIFGYQARVRFGLHPDQLGAGVIRWWTADKLDEVDKMMGAAVGDLLVLSDDKVIPNPTAVEQENYLGYTYVMVPSHVQPSKTNPTPQQVKRPVYYFAPLRDPRLSDEELETVEDGSDDLYDVEYRVIIGEDEDMMFAPLEDERE